jgi:predicted transcriptional regulator of viral defense system
MAAELRAFFVAHPVFSRAELTAHLRAHRSGNPKAVDALLRYHVQAGHLVKLRRGLYAVVPAGADPVASPVDPYLLASRLAPDAVLGYHSALELHGKAHSVFQEFYFLTGTTPRPFQFRRQRFRAVAFPRKLARAGKERFGVETCDRAGLDVAVIGLERTLVDLFDRPDLGGGLEEVWRSLEVVEFLDIDAVTGYALLLGNATTVAKVGIFLEAHRERLMVSDAHLTRLRRRRPRQPHYFEKRNAGRGRLVAGWNLVVPESVVTLAWEEPS